MSIPRTAVQAGIYSTSRLLSKLISFVALIYFAREVGAAHFGVYTYILSLILIFQPFSRLGMFGEINRRSKSKTLKFLSEGFYTLILLNFIFSTVTGVVVYLKGYSIILSLLTTTTSILLNLSSIYNMAHMVWGRIRFVSIATFVERISFALLVLIFPKKTVFIFASFIISYTLANLFLMQRVSINPKRSLTKKFFSWEFFMAVVFIAIASRVPQIIYEHRFGVVNLGNFGIAFLIVNGLSMFLSDAGSFLVFRGGLFGKTQYSKLKKLLIPAAILLFISVVLLNPLVGVFGDLIFGSGYDNASTMLSIMLMGLSATVLYFYPRVKLSHNSPKRYVFSIGVYMVFSIYFALRAENIVFASILSVVAQYIHVGFSWVLADTLKVKG